MCKNIDFEMMAHEAAVRQAVKTLSLNDSTVCKFCLDILYSIHFIFCGSGNAGLSYIETFALFFCLNINRIET